MTYFWYRRAVPTQSWSGCGQSRCRVKGRDVYRRARHHLVQHRHSLRGSFKVMQNWMVKKEWESYIRVGMCVRARLSYLPPFLLVCFFTTVELRLVSIHCNADTACSPEHIFYIHVQNNLWNIDPLSTIQSRHSERIPTVSKLEGFHLI